MSANAAIAAGGPMPTEPTRKRVSINKAADALLRAVGRYVKATGGEAVVAGPIGLMRKEPRRFALVIECLGRAPEKPDADR